MKQKTINLYQFNELSDDQKQKVIEKYRDFNDDIFDSYVNDECCTLELFENGFLNPTIHYDLSYCQGSGACFDCNDFDFELLLKDFECKHKNWIIDILNNYCECKIYKNSYGYHYSHSKTRYFEINTYGVDRNYREYPRILEIIRQVDCYIENLRYKLSESLTDRLYQELEFLRSDEQIADALIANEYYFNAETLEIEN